MILTLNFSVDAMRQLGRCWLWPGRLLSSQHPLYSWRYFTRTYFSEVLTCTSPQVLSLVLGLSNSGPLCLRANYWPQCPGLSALGTWHYFFYQVAKGLKLLCDHVSAGEKSLKLPSSGAKSVPPPPLLWVEAIVHLKSRNWPRSYVGMLLVEFGWKGWKYTTVNAVPVLWFLMFPLLGSINVRDVKILR